MLHKTPVKPGKPPNQHPTQTPVNPQTPVNAAMIQGVEVVSAEVVSAEVVSAEVVSAEVLRL